jgi:hypothetical protein
VQIYDLGQEILLICLNFIVDLSSLDIRIKTNLYPHQKMALTFLLAREQKIELKKEISVSETFWRKIRRNGQIVYQNTLNGQIRDTLLEARGGILADEVVF